MDAKVPRYVAVAIYSTDCESLEAGETAKLNRVDVGPPSDAVSWSWLQCLQLFAAKLVLEVWGAAGAIWGFSEVLALRYAGTNGVWRMLSLAVAAVFVVRWLVQLVQHIRLSNGHNNSHLCTSKAELTEPSVASILATFLAKLVLEVFGGAGAIWGFSEVVLLRYSETLWFWRPVALLFGGVFYVRWIVHLVGQLRNSDSLDAHPERTWVRLARLFSAKLVLEVLGGAGAVWGFSEVVTLRNEDTESFWRPVALLAGFVFFIRLLVQMRVSVEDISNGEDYPTVCEERSHRFSLDDGEFSLKIDYGTYVVSQVDEDISVETGAPLSELS